MRNIHTLILVVCTGIGAQAQTYCSPTFVNGCFLWRNQSISIGTINWTIGATDCAISDYTGLSTAITAGVPEPMTVVSGNWTGCAVWVDLNNDQTFQDTENLYYIYVGGDPGYTYNFTITIPASTPAGAYRMRVIAPWGSDGFLDTNTNGYGPCGAYQYGNFDDFTLNVSGSTSISAEVITGSHHAVHPNPTTGVVTIGDDVEDPIERITISTPEGRVMHEAVINATSTQVEIDLGEVPPGLYLLTCRSASTFRTLRIVKQ